MVCFRIKNHIYPANCIQKNDQLLFFQMLNNGYECMAVSQSVCIMYPVVMGQKWTGELRLCACASGDVRWKMQRFPLCQQIIWESPHTDSRCMNMRALHGMFTHTTQTRESNATLEGTERPARVPEPENWHTEHTQKYHK